MSLQVNIFDAQASALVDIGQQYKTTIRIWQKEEMKYGMRNMMKYYKYDESLSTPAQEAGYVFLERLTWKV